MKKKFFLLLACISFLFSAEDTYVFEAKGDFAKELKQLVEKHSKEEKINVKVYKKGEKKAKKHAILFEDGKKLYDKQCKSCHGEQGTKKAYNVSGIIKDMSFDDIDTVFGQFLSDDYDGKYAFIMKPVAAKTKKDDLKSIAYYLNDGKVQSDEDEEYYHEEPETYIQQGSYLK